MKKSWAAVLLIISFSTYSQEKYIHQGSYWIRYYNQTQLTDKMAVHFHVDERRLVNPSRQFQFFMHTHINYRVKPWLEVAAGGNFNWTNSSVNESLRVPEWRPWQELNVLKDWGKKWEFQFRYRLDERFIHNNDRIQLLDGYHFNLRHRFRVQLYYDLKTWDDGKAVKWRVSDELMYNTGDVADSFDQNRIYSSIEYRINKSWSIETGYLNLLQSRSSDDGYYDRHIIRFTIQHRVDLRRG